MIIGYQGAKGSNSEEAARIMAGELHESPVLLKPLTSADRVVGKLASGKVGFGVLAVHNSIGGQVAETLAALRDVQVDVVASCSLPIHHCLFISPHAKEENLRFVASHIQALVQTRETRKRKFPQLAEIETQDTALAAEHLATGLFPSDVAVLCRKEAGLSLGLVLLEENLEDSSDNVTEFWMVKLAADGEEPEKEPEGAGEDFGSGGREEPRDVWDEMFSAANAIRRRRRISRFVEAGAVSAAVLSRSGRIYTGVCVDTCSGLGICAERSALFAMLAAGESEIDKVLAITSSGVTGAPCGACRELMAQMMPECYKEIEVMLDYDAKRAVKLGELTPSWWF